MSNVVFELFAKLGLDSSEYEEGLKGAESKATSIGGTIAKGLGTVGKAGAVIGTALVGATTAAGTALVKGAGDVAAYGDNIDKMSQKMGISATAYQEWDAILQHSGTSIEALKPSMKTLATQAEKGNEAFQKLGISEQEVATLSQEDLFEKVISGLQGMEEGTERTYLTSQLLGKGATELGALLNTSAEDTEAMRQAVHDLGGIMSDDAVKAAAAYQDQLQDMQTGFDGLKRNLMSEFLPGITTVMGGLTDLFTGNYDEGLEKISSGVQDVVSNITNEIPKFLETGVKIIESLAQGILQNIPNILPALVNLVIQVADMIVQNLPLLIETGMQVIIQLALGIANALPELMPTIVNVILQIIEILIEHAPELIEASLAIMAAIATGLVQAIPVIVKEIPQIVEKIKTAFTSVNWAEVGTKVINFISNGIKSLSTIIPNALKEIGTKAITIFKSIDWKAVGTNVINFIVNGIKAFATNIPNLLKEIGTKATELFKKIDWVAVGSAVITFILNGIKLLVVDIPNALVDIGKNAISAMKEIDWLDLGKNIVNGIIEGLKSMASALVNVMVDLAKGAWTAVKKFFGIESPSKLMRDTIGKNVALGMAIGIEKGVPEVEEAMQQLNDVVEQPSIVAGVSVNGNEAYNGNSNSAFEQEQQYSKLASAIVDAFIEAGIGVEVDNREFGRLVRKAVTV